MIIYWSFCELVIYGYELIVYEYFFTFIIILRLGNDDGKCEEQKSKKPTHFPVS